VHYVKIIFRERVQHHRWQHFQTSRYIVSTL